MAKICQLTGVKPLTGNSVSHANNRTKRRQLPNLKLKKIWVAEENRFVKMKISTRALRTIKKRGLNSMRPRVNRVPAAV